MSNDGRPRVEKFEATHIAEPSPGPVLLVSERPSMGTPEQMVRKFLSCEMCGSALRFLHRVETDRLTAVERSHCTECGFRYPENKAPVQ